MTSGSYFPPAVKAVPIPKKSGGVRTLGIPTVADRIAQTAVKMWLEPQLDPIFYDDSYGYRPGKSALAAITITRLICGWRDNRTGDQPEIQFTFLGYTFRPRKAVDKYGRVYVNFS